MTIAKVMSLFKALCGHVHGNGSEKDLGFSVLFGGVGPGLERTGA